MTGPEYNPQHPPGPYGGGPQQPPTGPYPPGPQYQPGQYPPGSPPPGGGAYPPPGGAYPPPAPPKKSGAGRVIGGIVGAVIVIGIIIAAVVSQKGNPDSAKVGDCIHHGSGDEVKVVSCTDSSAGYKVVGKVEDKTQTQFDISSDSICKPFQGAESAFWKGKVGKTGYVLCLAPLNR